VSDTPDDDATLDEVREWVWDGAINGGVICPCCTQSAKVYRRAMSNATARFMIRLYRYNNNQGRDFVYMPAQLDQMRGTPHQGGYGNLAQHWGLLEKQPGIRKDGSNRTGWWRLTTRGRAFVENRITVPKYAYIYDNECLGLGGAPWSIIDALGEKFDYRALMSA
jgi:hypothetical protein